MLDETYLYCGFLVIKFIEEASRCERRDLIAKDIHFIESTTANHVMAYTFAVAFLKLSEVNSQVAFFKAGKDVRVIYLGREYFELGKPFHVVEVHCHLHFLRLRNTELRLKVINQIFKLIKFRRLDHISIGIPDVFRVWDYKASLIHDLAYESEFDRVWLLEIKEVARLVALDRVQIVGRVLFLMTAALVKGGISYVNNAFPVHICCTLVIVIPLRTETYLCLSIFLLALILALSLL